MWKRLGVLGVAMASVLACGGSDVAAPAAPKPDPYVTIRLFNHLDTTTKAGRANWRVFVFLSGPNANLNGIAYQGGFTIADARSNRVERTLVCMAIGEDSIGQRLVAPFAIGDTLNAALQPNAATDSIVARWYAGNHAPAAGYIILTMAPADPWDSQQYIAGHGLLPNDPIKWAWDWTGSGTLSFAERAATDTDFCNTITS